MAPEATQPSMEKVTVDYLMSTAFSLVNNNIHLQWFDLSFYWAIPLQRLHDFLFAPLQTISCYSDSDSYQFFMFDHESSHNYPAVMLLYTFHVEFQFGMK